MENPQTPLQAPTALDIIRDKVLKYHEKMKWIADYLEDKKDVPEKYKIDKIKEFIEFYIDKPALKRIQEIADLDKCDHIAVYFGLTSDYSSITGCFLGIDAQGNVLDNHRKNGGPSMATVQKKGEDTWLPPGKGKGSDAVGPYVTKDFTLDNSKDVIEKHLQ
jgi:hypothetical protein